MISIIILFTGILICFTIKTVEINVCCAIRSLRKPR